jgi:hypothetical protein
MALAEPEGLCQRCLQPDQRPGMEFAPAEYREKHDGYIDDKLQRP